MIRVVALCALLAGCATTSPFDGAAWHESDDGRIALCVEDECFRPSESTWAHFVGEHQCHDGADSALRPD